MMFHIHCLTLWTFLMSNVLKNNITINNYVSEKGSVPSSGLLLQHKVTAKLITLLFCTS